MSKTKQDTKQDNVESNSTYECTVKINVHVMYVGCGKSKPLTCIPVYEYWWLNGGFETSKCNLFFEKISYNKIVIRKLCTISTNVEWHTMWIL